MSNEAFILEGTDANFATLVLENSRKGPVLVDFWAPGAGPSLRQGELLRRLARDYGGRFLLVSLDTDRKKAIAIAMGSRGCPPASFALVALLVVADDYHAALEQFADLERRTPGYRDGLGREGLLLVLDLLGPDDEQVRRYRRSLFGH